MIYQQKACQQMTRWYLFHIMVNTNVVKQAGYNNDITDHKVSY